MTVYADPRYFSTWSFAKNSAGTGRSRHDYDCPQHVFAEMQHDEYWSTMMVDIEAGDMIWITDGASEQALIKIDWKDAKARRVGFSLIERATEHPVVGVDGFAVKWRGPRGGYWCVIDKTGTVVKRDMRTADEAHRERDMMNRAAA